MIDFQLTDKKCPIYLFVYFVYVTLYPNNQQDGSLIGKNDKGRSADRKVLC
jgi:hypothetical protein